MILGTLMKLTLISMDQNPHTLAQHWSHFQSFHFLSCKKFLKIFEV